MHTLALELSERSLIPLLMLSAGFVLAFLHMVFTAITSIVRSRNLETSRREIAAYVAEGTMSPDDAAKLLEAGNKKKGWGCC
ncbi:MAG TPA: hypothetical protein VD997_10820 [Phycisphaerales bacterium]|nr:hypothetical protein [Phycisphaerales bacterium]